MGTTSQAPFQRAFCCFSPAIYDSVCFSHINNTSQPSIPHYQSTIKSTIQNELTIPQQTRYLVEIDMGPVERHVYDEAVERILLDLGLDARGVAAVDGWEPDVTVLRAAIRRLRAICTHPQIGQLQLRQGERMMKTTLKSMSEVLEVSDSIVMMSFWLTSVHTSTVNA